MAARRHAAVVVLILITLTGLGAGPQPTTKPAEIELKLIPSKDPPPAQTIDNLIAHPWTSAGPMDILGHQLIERLRFSRDTDGTIMAETSSISFKGFADRNQGSERKQTHRCQISGPVMRFGGQVQTFVVHDKELVVNAVAPAGDGKWYYAASLGDIHGGRLVEEYLFSFSDDPLKKDAGKVQIRARINDSDHKTDDAHFVLTRAYQDRRSIKVQVDGPLGPATRAEITFDRDGAYGLMEHTPNLNSKIFRADRADQK